MVQTEQEPVESPLWTLEEIYNIRDHIEVSRAEETPATIMGCTARPLLQHVPVYNYILSILHIIIGVEKNLLTRYWNR